MPFIVRVYLRTALVMFVLALMVGVAQNLSSLVSFLPPGLTPVYFHLLMVGWVTQFILGVAIWMLPKYSTRKIFHPIIQNTSQGAKKAISSPSGRGFIFKIRNRS